MPLNLRWVGESDFDRVVQTRLYCYAANWKDQDLFKNRLQNDKRCKSGDYLLAERDGLDVGTLTSLSLNMWIRGANFPCQGIAWVGTVKTHRRGGSGGEKGIASQLMHEGIRLARERGEVISSLMPFRASFYEHFGYGFAEGRTEWNLPISVCPTGNFEGFRFKQPGDETEMAVCRNRIARAGQCDIERTPEGWHHHFKIHADSMFVVDRPKNNGAIHGWMALAVESRDGKSILRITDREHDSIDALKRQLHFLASMKDQHSFAIIHLPSSIPLHLLMRETQLPHRLVEHSVPAQRPYTRMQIRVLDHRRLLESIRWPEDMKGKATISIKEAEGSITPLAIDVANGHATVSAGSGAAIECSDVHWAEIVAGYAKASELAQLGLIRATDANALKILDALSEGPAPFCMEYF
jgi:predicted acetyltransferase